MYKSSATRSADETREVIDDLAKNMVLVTFTTDAQSFNTLLDSTIPSELKNYVQDIVRDGHRAPSDQRVKEVGGASGQRPEEVQARQNSDGVVDFSMTRPEVLSPPGNIL